MTDRTPVYCEQVRTSSPLQNFSYLIYNSEKSIVICIDPWDGDEILDLLQCHSLVLTHIINTHAHFDHIRGNSRLRELFPDVEILAHRETHADLLSPTQRVVSGERLQISEHSYLQFMETPGHTLTHICILFVRQAEPYAFFTGDTIFQAGVGNCYNGGAPEVLYETCRIIREKVSPQVYLFCGHDYLDKNLDFALSIETQNAQAKSLKAELAEYKKQASVKQGHQLDAFTKASSLVGTLALEYECNPYFRLSEVSLRCGLRNYLNDYLRHNDTTGHLKNLAKRLASKESSDTISDQDIFLSIRLLRDAF